MDFKTSYWYHCVEVVIMWLLALLAFVSAVFALAAWAAGLYLFVESILQ